jgi:DNA-binding transcriptional regulator GbsR (MarR family)
MEPAEFFGKNAGKVWKCLSGGGPKTLTELQKATGLSLKEASMGLGWLAKEGKIALKNAESLHAKFELSE